MIRKEPLVLLREIKARSPSEEVYRTLALRFICQRDEVQDARVSVLCKTYVHEICADLTATDFEVICPLCKKYWCLVFWFLFLQLALCAFILVLTIYFLYNTTISEF